MHKCCTSSQTRISQRRINGLQLPLNYQQIIGWIIFVITGTINIVILAEVQFDELRIVALATYMFLYISHMVSHVTASYIDPSENSLRKLPRNNVPEFDRSIHAHVIENGRCHLCNIYTSSKKTKHCSICNKCVDHFDHHCKWLNNCVGMRNYTSFVASVITALLISVITSSLCVTDIVLFILYPQRLSPTAQEFINCTTVDKSHYIKYCSQSIIFLVLLIILCISAFAIACALLHLCCFHIYISILGVSTYEYIMKSDTSDTFNKCICPRMNISNKLNVGKIKKRSKTYHSEIECSEQGIGDSDPRKLEKVNNSPVSSEPNLSNLIGVIINSELSKAKKIFFYDRNKIHPHKENSSGS
ncbi:probable palmitoyltransferase ZDHHC11B [Achroia grisella]|uniref:probable palmitoyltransferase ZDHHC11B n=1 Tax=Achroia grisella TaxID=688607 RepID=UPI0027D290FA|nr:probable palmitoyltransferase ZDHHC11B [Achroia grisella]